MVWGVVRTRYGRDIGAEPLPQPLPVVRPLAGRRGGGPDSGRSSIFDLRINDRTRVPGYQMMSLRDLPNGHRVG